MLTINDLGRVDSLTGQATLSVDLATLAGRQGLDLTLSASYSSASLENACAWNQALPTGVLGLGWTLPIDRIFAVVGRSAAPDDLELYASIGALYSRLWRTGTASDGAWLYALENYAFWQIRYYPGTERWTVIDEDGVTRTFGDAASGRDTVVWSVAWSGWFGASAQLGGQARFASAWLLSQASDRFGDAVTYYYDAVEQSVGAAGGARYTQASYLARVIGVDGSQAVFTYADKTAAEYQDPHTHPPPPNAWQDAFETRYLASVASYAPDGTARAGRTFGYALLASGTLTKRLLTSVTETSASTGSPPPARFTYWGQQQSDGVSAANVYNAANHALYGALNQVTLTDGGTVSYQYSPSTLQYSDRAPVVTPPSGSLTYSKPRFAFAGDYVLAVWLGSDGAAWIKSYTWQGRFIATTVGSFALSSPGDYDTLVIEAANDTFALFGGGKLQLFQADATRFGQWIASSVLTPALGTGEAGLLAVGDGFGAVLGATGGSLYRWRFVAGAWAADTALPLGGGTGAVYAIGAEKRALVATAAASDGTVTAFVFRASADGSTWQQGQAAAAFGGVPLTQAALAVGETFAAFQGSAPVAGQLVVTYGALWWDASLSIDSVAWPRRTIASGATPAPTLVHGSAVAIGAWVYRFDGVEWTAFNTASITYPNQQSAIVAPGADVVARRVTTSGTPAYVYDTITYDPQTGQWSVPAGLSQSSSSAAIAVTAARGGTTSDYAVFMNAVYYRAAGGTWSSIGALAGTLSAADAATVQLVGSSYVVYQQNTGQANVQTVVYLLGNGALAAGPLTLAGESVVNGTAPLDTLVGRNAFVSFTGTYGAQGSTLKLHRPLRGDVASTQVGYAVSLVTADNGFSGTTGVNATVPTSYAFGGTGATIDRDGWLPMFNTSTQARGSTDGSTPNGSTLTAVFNGLAPSEPPALAYPTGANTNAATWYSASAGLVYIVQLADQAGTNIGGSTSYWWVTTAAPGAGQSGYARALEIDETSDGVTRTTAQTFAAETGLITSVTRSNYTSDAMTAGASQQLGESYRYFWEIYDPTRALNLLTPMIQVSMQSVTGTNPAVVTSIDVQTWRGDWGFGAGQWAPNKAWQALSGSPPAFNSWQPSDPDPTSGWRLSQRIVTRNPHGFTIDAVDGIGRHTSIGYDASGTYVVASADNAAATGDLWTWYGCEPYETTQGWGSSDPGKTILDYVTTADFHTGSRSLALPAMPASPAGPMRVFQPSEQTRRYLFSCWARTPPGFAPASGLAQLTLAFFNPANGQSVGTPIVVNLSPAATVGRWSYFPTMIDLPARVQASGLAALGMTATATNANSTSVCYLDELRFMPLDASFAANVYDGHWLRTATIDANGQPQQLVYDGFERPFIGVGPLGRIDWLQAVSYSRALSSSDAFLPEFPNSTLSLRTTAASLYYDFHDANLGDWIFTDSANWNATGGALNYAGTGTGPLGATALYNPVAYTSFAARIEVSVPSWPASGGGVALGNGDLFMRWNQPSSAWQLVRLQSGTVSVLLTNSATPFGRNWVFNIVDGLVTCWCDGAPLFAYQSTAPSPPPANYGKVTLATAQPSSFDNLALLDSPQVAVQFADGLGRPLQGLSLEGYEPSGGAPFPSQSIVLGSGVLLDALGRPYVERSSMTAPIKNQTLGSTQLIDGNQATYLTDAGGDALTIAQFLAGQGGAYNFAQRSYETTPLERPLTVIAPRATTAAAANFTTQLAYGCTSTVGALPGPGPGHYRAQSTTAVQAVDSGGAARKVVSSVTRDLTGKELMRLSGPVAGPYRQIAFLYDDAQRLSTVLQPNYFAPPDPTTKSSWMESYAWNFVGTLASQQTPDAGLTQFVYDSADRSRFSMDATGSGLSPQRLQYVKYDALDRIVETGTIQDSRYAWGGAALLAKLDVAAFPIVDPARSTDPNYAAGSWRKQFVYDTDGAAATPYLVGRVWRASINQNGTSAADTETYSYDAYGNVAGKAVSMPAASPAVSCSVGFTYDGMDQLATIAYPALDSHAPAVARSYDRLGRLAAVGHPDPSGGVVDPSNPPPAPARYYAEYDYDYFGRITTASLNNGAGQTPIARTFQYDGSGLCTSIADGYFSETVDYNGGGGANGWRYYDGQAAAVSSAFAARQGFTPPAPLTTQYQYDSASRLQLAVSSLGDGQTIDLSGAGAYDANGNIINMRQGQTSSTYGYQAAQGGHAPINNRAVSVAAQVSNSLDFAGVPPAQKSANGWSWGSNNGGPSQSQTTTTTTPQSLKLTGGSLGHYEVLAMTTWLAPAGTYTLGCKVQTDDAFAQSIGEAGWYAIVMGASGPIAEKTLATITASSSWTTLSMPVSPAALSQQLGLSTPVVGVSLELRNAKRNADGTTGASLFVTDLTLTGSTTGAYGYDAAGAVNATPSLYALNYDPTTRLTTSTQVGSSTGDVLAFSLGGDDRRTSAVLTNGTTTLAQRITVRGIDGEPLAERLVSGGVTTTRYYIQGVQGPLAIESGGAASYFLQDRLGSTRALVAADGSVSGTLDYLPFGSTVRATPPPDAGDRFTGQWLDDATGLYNYNARFYDPALARFYATDPAGSHTSPYAYVGNDPINMVDPTGAVPWFWLAAVVGALHAAWWEAPYAATSDTYYGRLWQDFTSKDEIDKWRQRWPSFLWSTAAELIHNLSNEELKVINRQFWYLGPLVPFALPYVAVRVYLPVYSDIQRNAAGDPEKGNAIRHFGWVCRATQILGGNAAFARELGDAHERGRPGIAKGLALYDSISDKINNEIALHKATTSSLGCEALYTAAWDVEKILVRNSEGRPWVGWTWLWLVPSSDRAAVLTSIAAGLRYLDENNLARPEFTDIEQAQVDAALKL